MASGAAPKQQSELPATSPSRPAQVLDQRRWVGRAFYFDVLSLVVLPLAALGLAFDIYTAGYLRAFAAPTAPSFAPLVRIGLELLAFGGSYAWMAARLTRAGYRELPVA